MLRKIYILLTLILLTGILLTSRIACTHISDFNTDTNRDRLHTAINFVHKEISDGASYAGAETSLRKIFEPVSGNIRLTIIDSSGEVLFDNEADEAEMDNHLFRPEVYGAYKNKSVEYAVRKSDTMNVEIFYLAEYKDDMDVIIRTSIPMVEYKASINDIVYKTAGILAVSFVALLIAGMLALNILTKPLKKLEKAAVDMSKGEYETRVYGINEKNSEISNLAIAFNEMAQRLENVIKDLEEKNVHMKTVLDSVDSAIIAVDKNMNVTFMNRFAYENFGELTDSEERYSFISVVRNFDAEKSLVFAMAENRNIQTQITCKSDDSEKHYIMSVSLTKSAKGKGAIITFKDITNISELQKMKSEFVANVTHELKTPLTSIRGFVDTLKRGAYKEEKVAEKFLDIIDVEAERLHKLITDILILSEIEDDRQRVHSQQFDMIALVDEVAVLLDEEASLRKVSIIPDYDREKEQRLPVKADRDRIKQILINLIENAVRYNRENGKVYIDVYRKNPDEIEIKVSDTGNGIPKEHLPRVFERFYRVDKGRSKDLGGTGLGLSIVKHIAMLYDGKAKAESNLGEGSVFTVTLRI